jgi:exoribonuclease II
MLTLEELRFPIGKFKRPEVVSDEEFNMDVQAIQELPDSLKEAVKGLNEDQLNTPYRDGGWTIKQVVHHLFDSHANSYVRMKLALTEDNPTIKPYDESLWAELDDAKYAPIELSINLLDALHKRWVLSLTAFGTEEKKRTFNHPESGIWRLDKYVGLYGWHCIHHVAHITGLRKRMGW